MVKLIEDSTGKAGFVSRFIEKHGEGMHHLSIEVNHLAPVLAALKADGVRVVDEQSFPGGAMTAFISPRAAFGTLIQFWQVPDSTKITPIPRMRPLTSITFRSRSGTSAVRWSSSSAIWQRRQARAHLNHRWPSWGTCKSPGSSWRACEPGKGSSNDFVGRFIERHGEGMHHISMDLRDFDGTLARLKAGGIRVVDESTNRRGEREFFISPRSAFGTLIQVWDMG